MAIWGIGCDIEEISRIERLCRETKFLNKAFTDTEQAYINNCKKPYMRAAGIFCAKEALSKAVGTGFRGFYLRDIEVVHNAKGKPFFNLSSLIKDKFPGLSFSLSISHCNLTAMAVVIAEERGA